MIWILFTCAVIIIIFSLFYFYIGYGSKHWPSTKGKVTRSCIITKINKASSSNNEHYHPNIHYEYAVANKKYKSNKIGTFLGFDADLEFAPSIINQFPEKKTIDVYYCPYFPKISVLITGMQQLAANYLMLFIGIIAVLGTYPVLFTNNPNWFVNLLFGLFN